MLAGGRSSNAPRTSNCQTKNAGEGQGHYKHVGHETAACRNLGLEHHGREGTGQVKKIPRVALGAAAPSERGSTPPLARRALPVLGLVAHVWCSLFSMRESARVPSR